MLVDHVPETFVLVVSLFSSFSCTGQAGVPRAPADGLVEDEDLESEPERVDDTAASSGSQETEPVSEAFESTSGVGMTFEWRLEGAHLRGRMRAPTTGWVTVGFNHEDRLGGSKLIMGHVVGDRVVVEEHIADPPEHRPKTELGGHHAISDVSGYERDGSTTIEFLVELDSGDPVDVVLRAGDRYHVTLAWSHEDDFYHHSARRTAVEIIL